MIKVTRMANSSTQKNDLKVLWLLIKVEFRQVLAHSQCLFWIALFPMLVMALLMFIFNYSGLVLAEGIFDPIYLLCGVVTVQILAMGFFAFAIPLLELRHQSQVTMHRFLPIWRFGFICSFALTRALLTTVFSALFILLNNFIYQLGISFSIAQLFNILVLVFCASLTVITIALSLLFLFKQNQITIVALNTVFYLLMVSSNLFMPKALPQSMPFPLDYPSPMSYVVASLFDTVSQSASLLSQAVTFFILFITSITALLLIALLTLRQSGRPTP